MWISSAHKYRVGRLPSSKISYFSFSPCGCFMSGWRNPEQVSARLRARFSHDLFDFVFDTRDLWILSLCHTTDYEVCMVMGQNPGIYIIRYLHLNIRIFKQRNRYFILPPGKFSLARPTILNIRKLTI